MLVEEPSRTLSHSLCETLRQRIQERTCGRLWWHWVELRGDQVIVHGSSPSYYVVQLALAAVREMLPLQPVDLDIQVGFRRPQADGEGDAGTKRLRGAEKLQATASGY